jgi:hypothetical protein
MRSGVNRRGDDTVPRPQILGSQMRSKSAIAILVGAFLVARMRRLVAARLRGRRRLTPQEHAGRTAADRLA